MVKVLKMPNNRVVSVKKTIPMGALALVAFMSVVVGFILLAVLVGGCATTPPIRVWTRAMYNTEAQKVDWFADGPDLTITVENNTNEAIVATVECKGAKAPWVVNVPARGFVSGLGRVLNVDTMDACRLSSVETVMAAR